MCCLLAAAGLSLPLRAQFDIDNPQPFVIAGIEVTGAQYSDQTAVIGISGLSVGETIMLPGSQISDAVKRLWKENIFGDVAIRADRITGNKVFLVIEVAERPRISQFSFQGISKSQADELREKINFIRGTILTESKRKTADRVIRNFYIEKGFFNTRVEIETEPDKILKNGVTVNIKIDKGERIKIEEIRLAGNAEFSDLKVKRKLKKTKEQLWFRVWQPSKYIPKVYEEAKDALLAAYQEEGFRDALIIRDTMYQTDPKHVIVEMDIQEGIKYYHRNIAWVGNLKYDTRILNEVLSIKRGDVYSKARIDKRLFGDPNGSDVSSIYLDDGYLFFNVDAVEAQVEGDSIDLELRVQEGPQAIINDVTLDGNTKTSDQVVFRELRTTPGQKFSRSDIIRTQREILALNYFDQEKLNVAPQPNPQNGTVAIRYGVEERPSDQLQLQGGWGGRQFNPLTNEFLGGGFIGTVQLGFNNFSTKRFLQRNAWRPVPSGDGQQVSLAVQMNGANFQNYSISFIEPWFGGKKPNSLGISANYYIYQNPSRITENFRISTLSASVDYGRRLKFPDDFFTSRTSLSYKYYDIVNPSRIGFIGFTGESRAFVNILTLRQSFDRSSVDAPIYPRSGSIMSLSVEATPPYSLVFNRDRDYTDLSGSEKYNLLEYHKWKFLSSWFFRIAGNLVLNTKLEAGFLGAYNPQLGIPPFERFFLGGAGLVGTAFAGFNGQEILPLRGYENNSLTNNGSGYPFYNRFVTELRYPISLNQSAPVWVLGYLEGGNGYSTIREYSPFNLRRAAGVGLRVMLPMVGLLGLDWGYGFDAASDSDPNRSGSRFHFILGQNF